MRLWEQLSDAGVLTQWNWGWDGKRFQKRTYGEMFESARHVGAGLRARGVQAGEVVPAVLTNGLAVPAGILGAWMAGATLASLPIIARGMSPERYGEQILSLAELLDANFILVEDRFISMLPDDAAIGIELVSFEALKAHSGRIDPQFPGPSETALVQFSSGTTGEPRGAELTTEAVDFQLQSLRETFDVGPGDIGYSWLPMSHDMGLIGCALLSWYSGMVSVLSAPERFLQAPRSWLEDCVELQATVTAAPPFALDLAVRADKINPLAGKLRIRQCFLGAERIDWNVLTRMAATFEDRGLDLPALTSAYGLAEATLVVTAGSPEDAPTAIDVDPTALAQGTLQIIDSGDRAEEGMRVVSVGRPLPGMAVAVAGEVGEVRIDSPSLAKGYFKNEVATAERFMSDGFRTADIGFELEGQLFVTGRTDDLIIVGGRNIYVEALEEELASQKGIRKGSCAIVATQCDEAQVLGVVAEVKPDDYPDLPVLEEFLRRQVLTRIGVSVNKVVLLWPGDFPKTPSGKVQRYRCRQMISEPTDRVIRPAGSTV